MSKVAVPELKKVIESQHGGTAIFAQSAPVKETYDASTVWEGVVQVVDLECHPTATCAYASSSPIEGSENRLFSAVLHLGRIRSPLDAVRATIAAERQGCR